MILETQRLRLVEAQDSDDTFFFKLLNSPNWLEFIGNRNIHTLKDARDYIQKSLINSYQTNGYGLYKMILKKNMKDIGICGLVKRPTLDHPDIGFAILPAFEKKGYTIEAAKGILTYAKTILRLEKILAITTLENTGSQRILSKIGLTQTNSIPYQGNGETMLVYTS